MSFNEALKKASDNKEDVFAKLANDYAKMSNGQQHPTGPPAAEMLKVMNAAWPFSKAKAYLDNGCGPGVIMDMTLKEYSEELPPSCRLVAADFSAAMVQQVEELKKKNIEQGRKIWERVEAEQCDAEDMASLPDGTFSHISAGMVYFMVANPKKALTESRRVLTSENGGGVLALSSWKGNQWMDLMEHALKVKPGTPFPGMIPSWTSTEGVRQEMEAVGFREVEVKYVETSMFYEDAEKYCRWMAANMPVVSSILKDWTPEEKEQYVQHMIQELTALHGEKNGTMKGTTIVGVGRK